MIDALVLGAGPTGLTAALDLTRRGVHVRIVDAASGPFEGSRGKGVTARTQEVFDDLGIVDELVASGLRHLPFRVSVGGVIRSDADPMAGFAPTPDRPYESGLIIPQWRTEQILRTRLEQSGVRVEYDTAAVAATEHDGHVTVELDGDGPVDARYVIGCDGGRSTARSWVATTFDGHGGPQAMLIADVHVDGLTGDRWYQNSDPEKGFVALCPFRNTPFWQFQGGLWEWFDEDGGLPEPTLDLVQHAVGELFGPDVRVSDPAWMSRWRVNVRLVDRVRNGRIFLAGDAAHVHSPAGGLGMNTGIQDAYNLGWKIGAVLRGADVALLDSYQDERLPIAEWTLGMSTRGLDAVTENMTSGASTQLIQPLEDGQQLGLGYRWSGLSVESTPYAVRADTSTLRAGDRAPDGPHGESTFFDAFRGPHATLVAVGDIGPLPESSDRLAVVRTPEAPWYSPADALFVVRPDGYVGFAGVPGDEDEARRYLRRIAAV